MSFSDTLGRCDFCDAQDVPVREYETRFPNTGEKRLLCELCCCTPAGNALLYPDQHTSAEKHIMKTICFVGNQVLKALAKR